ncbi:MAG: hypothetical protein NTZ32_18685 [Planctomycetales bacterium]|nr:hypothetical protein [Planctomycetales bacterium]
MNLKTSSVRVASLFGRLAVVALGSPAVGIAIRAAASAVSVVGTLARRFVRR